MNEKSGEENNIMEKIVSLCKRRGFVFQGSEIYGGLAGTWDYGPYGAELANNIKNLWWKMFVSDREDMYGIDAAIIMHPKAWESSGHVHGYGFADPLVECKKCHHRFRADQLDNNNVCPDCSGELGEQTHFNLMFKTNVGTGDDISYLRPETAGGIFVNYKNIIDSIHPKIPFGMAQIGKAFRNEIAPRDFVFRSREFRQMEVEYFIDPKDWEKSFEEWRNIILSWCKEIGLNMEHVHELEVEEKDRAFYSKRTIDFEFDYPFGRKELYGLAYRTDHDLKAHSTGSSVDLDYYDEETKDRFTPHVIEPSLGVDRTILAVLCDSYVEDDLGGDERVYLKFLPKIAPVKIAVFPLLKNKSELVGKAREVYKVLKKEFGAVVFDDNGNIGKRYRRQDEIGTPWCVTVDFETIEKDGSVTMRDRDTGEQKRMSVEEVVSFVKTQLS
ncbi:MAG: glycyl-tRNA synthetase [Parcubacteria group bacterium Gr01-1014_46]|nr:MAG: glycyl-tRNA synthetase [Parcubacteria group bacterium Gr01-1014_46]